MAKGEQYNAALLDEWILDDGLEETLENVTPDQVADPELRAAWATAKDAVKRLRDAISVAYDKLPPEEQDAI